jgi:putative acetyltransferase
LSILEVIGLQLQNKFIYSIYISVAQRYFVFLPQFVTLNIKPNTLFINQLVETNLSEVKPFINAYRKQLLSVWERSVLASHDFLAQKDFALISAMMNEVDFNAFGVYCLMSKNEMIGFIGVDGEKIEMLFVDPKYFGKGYGRKLMNFAINVLDARLVDVNEQNKIALAFYQNMGFKVIERTAKDGQGMDYPLLKMKLQ